MTGACSSSRLSWWRAPTWNCPSSWRPSTGCGAAKPEGKDTLDQLLDVLSVRFTPKEHTGADTIPQWSPQKQQPGWLIPLAVGFKDISGPMRVRHQRSYDYEHHFAESVVTICEFKMPFHFRDLEEIMWNYQTIPQLGLYLCKNSNQWNTKQH